MGHKRRDADLVALMKGLQNKTISPRDLTPRQRKLIVLMIIRENSTITNGKIADIIGVSESQVSRIRKQAIRCTTFDVDTEVRELVNVIWMKSNEYQRRALAEGDPRGAWSIFKDSIELFQSIGFVFQAPRKVALAHFQGESTSDLEASLKAMFDATGVPSLPEFISRMKRLSSGEQIKGNGNDYRSDPGGNGGKPSGNGGDEGGNGKGTERVVIEAVAVVVSGDNRQDEKGGAPVDHREKDKK